MDLNKSIRLAVDSGEVVLGTDKTKKLALTGKAKIIVLSSNALREQAQDVKHYCNLSKTPLVVFQGTSIELGTVCGKPFPISALSVLNEGNSDILKAAKQ